ncbi:MAG: methyltransferase domain-containing protein [Candidatus Margulisiibacteriota bacterium]|jgi:malonyl-CoA O-methyltransferase
MLDKNRIKNSFSRQAASYEKSSFLQQGIANQLALRISGQPQTILDIGCGTGYLTGLLLDKYPKAKISALDIAPGMIEIAKAKYPGVEFSVADAEVLPYPDQSFDCVISSTTYQWLPDLEKALAEVQRVLLGDGNFVFSLFGGKTLYELREVYNEAFQQLYPGKAVPLHPFISMVELFKVLESMQIITLKKEIITLTYFDIKSLLQQIKGWGAQNAHIEKIDGLGMRPLLALTEKLYKQKHAVPAGIQVTWEVFYGKARKKQ